MQGFCFEASDFQRVCPSPGTIPYPYPLFKSDDEQNQKLKPNQVGSYILYFSDQTDFVFKQNFKSQVGSVYLYGARIVSLAMDGKERLCLAQISNTLLKEFSYNEIHNRRVALGITCVQCTPVQVR